MNPTEVEMAATAVAFEKDEARGLLYFSRQGIEQGATLLVSDDKVPAFRQWTAADYDDLFSLALLFLAAKKLNSIKVIVFAPPGKVSEEVVKAYAGDPGQLIAYIDLYDKDSPIEDYEDREGVRVANTLKGAGVPVSNIVAWTKQPYAKAGGKGLMESGVFGAWEKKLDAPSDFDRIGQTLNDRVALVSSICEALIWRDSEAKWFSSDGPVPHDADGKTASSVTSMKSFIKLLLKVEAPESWFSEEDYPYLHYSLRRLIGSCAKAHNGVETGALSLGGLVMAWMIGLRDSSDKSSVISWRWQTLKVFASNPNLSPAKYPKKLCLSVSQSQTRTLVLAAAHLAEDLASGAGHSGNSGFSKIEISANRLKIHFSFEAEKMPTKEGAPPFNKISGDTMGLSGLGEFQGKFLRALPPCMTAAWDPPDASGHVKVLSLAHVT